MALRCRDGETQSETETDEACHIAAAPPVIGDGDVQAPIVDDGYTEEGLPDVDEGIAEAPNIDVGNAEPEDEESPLGHDGRRDL